MRQQREKSTLQIVLMSRAVGRTTNHAFSSDEQLEMDGWEEKMFLLLSQHLLTYRQIKHSLVFEK